MPDLNEVVRQMVADEVERVLGPYQGTLSRLSAVFGGGEVMPAARRARAGGNVAQAPVRRRAPGRRGGGAGKGDASAFSEGQKVRYKQGRGEFDATVTKIDAGNNVLTLQRVSDGKKVDRPAAKVYPA